MPNVGLDDDSSSSKSEGSPEEDIGCVGDGETSSVQGGMESPTLHGDATNAQRSPRHQTFTNGERRRRKLPEIPKNKRCEYYIDIFLSITLFHQRVYFHCCYSV